MAINKVVYGNSTLIDLTSDTVASDNLLSGATAHDRSGASIVGSVVTAEVVDNLTTQDATKALSANQGYVLNQNKVDKVSGKGLSTNDYTTTEKNKLAGIAAGAEVNVQPDWNQATTTADDYIKNKPTIPAAQVNSDWNASSGVAQILNKPTLATVATSGSYNDLSDKPTISTVNNGTLTIQKNGTNVATFTANQGGNSTANIGVPNVIDNLTSTSTTDALSANQGRVLNNNKLDKTDYPFTVVDGKLCIKYVKE